MSSVVDLVLLRARVGDLGHGSNSDGDIGQFFDGDMVRMACEDMVRPDFHS